MLDLAKFSPARVCFGGASLSGSGGGYGFGEISKQKAHHLLNYSYERGIKVFDTAPIYGFGQSEKTLGEVFKKVRESVFYISKSGVDWHSTKRVNMSNCPKVTERMLHQSLKDLKSDYIDLYMIHHPDKKIDIRKPMEVLAKAKQMGKISSIGLCNTSLEDYQKCLEIEKIEALQMEHNFYKRDSFESFKHLIEKDHLTFFCWGGLDKGILSGDVYPDRVYDPCDARSWAPWWKKENKEKKYLTVKKLKSVLEGAGYSLIDLSLHFLMKTDKYLYPLFGMKSSEHVDKIFDCLDHNIDKEVLESCEKIYRELWH
ncbi:aldo/keto reductase [bacterium]|nr:aldo/keto reductase [bacterium]